jgi:adenylate cyclase
MDNAEYKIGRFTLKPFRQLLEDGSPVTIGRKPLDLLSVLAKAEGALVTKDELMAAVWPKTIVEDNAIQVHIAALRKVLGLDAELLSTVHGLGYRLAVAPETPSTEPGSGPPPEAMQAAAARPWAMRIALTAVCVITVAAAGLWLVRDRLLWAPKPTNAPAAAARPAGISVAVLPFLNLSGNPADEYFSDGMTEEITLALVDVKGLNVVARSSAFAFKGRNEDVRSVGRALSATDVIEGSVRKQGSKLRISAELVRTDTGEHLWTQSYDRELKDVFAVQEDIATAIAGALQVPLGLSQGQNLVSSHTDDLDAYQQYLHARALFRARKADEAISMLMLVVARDPNYAPAWALLSTAIALPSQFTGVGQEIRADDMDKARLLAQSILDRAEKAAREAIRLDPRLAMGYSGLAHVELSRGNYIASADDVRQALALDPNDPDILYGYASFLADVGRLNDARRVQIQILAEEPFVPQYNRQAADLLWAMGQNDAALKMLEAMDSDQRRNLELAKVYATAGRYVEAADTLRATPASEEYPRQALDDAARLIRSAPGGAPNALPALGGQLNFVYLFVGAGDRYLDEAERRLQAGLDGGLFRDPWAPSSASLRKTERFKTFVRRDGFVDYWRARGWPEFCHPVGADDFACK